MTNVVWLASYPKSGNTWLRILLGCLSLREDEAVDINKLPERDGMASERAPFDFHLLIDSGLLTHDEIDCLRPRLYELLADEPLAGNATQTAQPVRFVKAHDAYTMTPNGEPLLAGRRGANGAIVIVRDPRDIAPSLAHHTHRTIDAAIGFMNNLDASFCGQSDRQDSQLRQKLPGWSGHIAGWLEQRDIPVHLLRYEDLKKDTAGAVMEALSFSGWPVERERVERAVPLAAFDGLQTQERAAGFGEWLARGASGKLFFRRGESGGWRGELTAEQVARIESAHGAMMLRLGYELTTGRQSASDVGRRA